MDKKRVEEAIKILDNISNSIKESSAIGQALEAALVSLEKQIPKKPENIVEDMSIFDCPACGHTILAIDDMTIHKNCLMCGQSLDWEGAE